MSCAAAVPGTGTYYHKLRNSNKKLVQIAYPASWGLFVTLKIKVNESL
jgi:hypothetical protein